MTIAFVQKVMSLAEWSESLLGVPQRRPEDIKERLLVHGANVRVHNCNRNFSTPH